MRGGAGAEESLPAASPSLRGPLACIHHHRPIEHILHIGIYLVFDTLVSYLNFFDSTAPPPPPFNMTRVG